MRAARFRPSLLPDHFAGLPVLLSPAAVQHEFPGAESRLGFEWSFDATDSLLEPEEVRTRLLHPMEDHLSDVVSVWKRSAPCVAVTFDVAPPVVVISVWVVSASRQCKALDGRTPRSWPFAALTRWLDRRIDARIAAHEARKRADVIEFLRARTGRPDAYALRPKVGNHAPGWMGA